MVSPVSDRAPQLKTSVRRSSCSESSMKRKKIFPVTTSDLEALSTKQLLVRLSRLHQCEESLVLSDRATEIYEASGAIEFKDSPEWAIEFKKLKEVLAQREHVSKGEELAESRRRKKL
jgi:hypothetical protein